MVREPIISPESTVTDDDRALRPQRIDEIVGQRAVYARLKIAIDAAASRGEPLGHILLDGPPGLGKTTFAMCVPRELGVSVQIANGATLKAPRDVVPYLTNAEERSVLFIDEIHRMQRTVEEFLYPAMEDFRIDLVLGEGVSARTLNMPLRPFTLIGSTTRTGMLSAPMRDRFQLREHLDFYDVDDLTEILRRNSRKLNVPMDEDAAMEVARRSRGTPRLANNRLRWCRDYAQARADGRITLAVAHDALAMAEIDHMGLDAQDQRYLQTLAKVFHGGPAGVDAIAHTMNVSPDTLEDEVEPFLLRSSLIIRTPKGRILTGDGCTHLGISPRVAGPQRTLWG